MLDGLPVDGGGVGYDHHRHDLADDAESIVLEPFPEAHGGTLCLIQRRGDDAGAVVDGLDPFSILVDRQAAAQVLGLDEPCPRNR